jgi:Bacteriophage holin of superfamily 6 (Holin_LLH)
MTISTESLNQLLNVLVQLMIIVIPILLSWIIRTYVKSSNAERGTAAIVRLANAGIDFVENLDNTGSLNLPPDYKKGVYKLKLATDFLESELQRAGIKMTTEDAQKWISSEFQKRTGEVRPVKDISALTSESADLVLDLEKRGILERPPQVERQAYLAELVADMVQARLTAQNWTNVPREELVTAARSELLTRFAAGGTPEEARDPLAILARDAVAFVQKLKAQGQLSVRPGTSGEDVERDVATAWLLTEVAKQGLAVSSTQIAQAVTNALQARTP